MSQNELFLPQAPTQIIKKCSYCQAFYEKSVNGIVTKTDKDDPLCEVSHGICQRCMQDIENNW